MIEGIILLVIAIVFVGYMVVKSKNKNADSAEVNGKSAVREMASGSAVPQAAPMIQSGIEEETVAAIMAAISCMTDSATGVKYTVRSINRVKSERPAWCFAGMQQNTRPF